MSLIVSAHATGQASDALQNAIQASVVPSLVMNIYLGVARPAQQLFVFDFI